MKFNASDIRKNVRDAYKSGRDWARCGYNHCYVLMINVDSGSIWSDCFDANHWAVYSSDSVIRLNVFGHPFSTVAENENYYFESAVNLLKNAGHEIE